MSGNLHILSIEPSGAGGIAHYTRFLDQALANACTKLDLLTATRWQYEMPPNVAIHKLFNRARTNPLRLFFLARRLRQSAQLVHWQSASHPQLLLWLMRLIPLKHLPWVYTVHNVLPHDHSPAMQPLYQKIYQHAQGLIFHNRHSQAQFQSLFPNIHAEQAVIPHGEYGILAGEDVSDDLPETPAVLFFGNIRPYKGLDILIAAMPLILQRIPNAMLHIAGQPLEDFSKYQQQIETLKITNAVTCSLHYLPDDAIPGLFRRASLVALPYYHIDQSGVLLLAAGMGRTVVATSVGGIPEVIQDGKTGLLVEPGNPNALADAIASILSDQNRLREIGKAAAHDIKQRFAWDAIADNTLNFYHHVLERYPHGQYS